MRDAATDDLCGCWFKGKVFLSAQLSLMAAFTLAWVIRESSEAEVLGQMFLEFFRASLFCDAPAHAGPQDCELAVAALLRGRL